MVKEMAPANETATNNSSLNAPLFSVCQALDDLKDPDKASRASITTSFSALVVIALTCPFTIFLNVIVLLAFYRKPALRTQANIFLGAMAVNDLLQGTVTFPLFLAKEIAYQMRHRSNCYVTVMRFVISHFSSDILLTALNCERFIGIKFPMWHRVHVTIDRLLLAVVISFLVGFSVPALRIFREEGRFVLVPLFIGCSIASLILAILIWRAVFQRNQQVQPLGAQQNQNDLVSRAEKKAAKTATYLTIGTLITRITPFLMLPAIFTKHDLMREAEPLLQCLSLLNSMTTPLIYGLTNDNIKKAGFELIKCEPTNQD